MKRAPQGEGAALQAGPGAHLLGRALDARYLIKTIIGVGGMGTVYCAEQFSMRRDVAVKVVRHDIQDENSVRRFLTEARAASRLKSPHTVTVFDFGRTRDGILYIAMELLEGRSLARELKNEGRPIPLVRAARLIHQVLDSMSEAHGLGILHRDLKPENVLLLDVSGSRDFLKVLDFGVAKMVGEVRPGTTAAGVSFGTPIYMSPEQMMGRKVGPETDLYSVAIMLFELLAGKPPLEGLSPIEIAMKKVEGKMPPLRQVNPRVESSDALEAFFARALAPDPANRPSDVKTFREELNRAVSAMNGKARPDDEFSGIPVQAMDASAIVMSRRASVNPHPSTVRGVPVVEDDESYTPPPAPYTQYEPHEMQSPAPVRPPPSTVRGVPVVTPGHRPAAAIDPRPVVAPGHRPAAAQPRAAPHPSPPQGAPWNAVPLAQMQVESGGDRPGPRIPVERIDEPAKASPPRPPETLIAAKPGRVPERRKRPRTTSLRNVVCLVGGTRHKALVAEISETGGYLYSHWMPRPGDNLSILFRPSDDTIGPAIIIASRVVRVVEKPATPGGVSGFSVKWLVLRTEGRLARLQAFYKNTFDADLPGACTHGEARLWEYWFEDRLLQRNVTRRNGV